MNARLRAVFTDDVPPAGPPRAWLKALDWWLLGGALGPVRRFMGATVVAVGPWIVFVLTLAIISITSAPVLGRAGLEDLRLTVTYAFCFAPMAAGPVGLAAAELARRSRDGESDIPVFDISRVALLLAGGASALLALVISLFLGIAPVGAVVSFVLLSAAAAMLWVCFAVLSALKLFRLLISAFLGGILLSVGGTFAIVRLAPSVDLLLWCFASGLIFCIAQSLNHLHRRYHGTPNGVRRAFRMLRHEIWRRRVLGAGVTLALIGIWADKWAFWLSPDALRSPAGFLHFSRYDSVMFVAHLSMIPTFSNMLMLREGELSHAFKSVQRQMQNHASHQAVRQAIAVLAMAARTGGFKLLFVQATIAGMLVLAAPWIAKTMSFDFQQFIVLRIALVALFLYSTFYVAGLLMVMCGRLRHFLLVQLVFVASNIAFSIVFIGQTGFTAYPLFLSSLISAAIAWPLAFRSISSYDFFYLLGENESLYED